MQYVHYFELSVHVVLRSAGQRHELLSEKFVKCPDQMTKFPLVSYFVKHFVALKLHLDFQILKFGIVEPLQFVCVWKYLQLDMGMKLV